MKRILVHIGSSKTGSTSIQDSLINRRNDSSVKFPVFRRRDHNILLPIYYERERWTDNYIREFWGRSDRYMERWTSGYRNRLLGRIRRADNIVISSEMIFTFDEESIHRFKSDLITAGCTDFKILAYIRRPSDHYLSLMQELLKHHNRYLLPVDYHHPVEKCLERWEREFPGSLECRVFQPNIEGSFDVVDDFYSVAEGFFDRRLEQGFIRSSSNRSLTAEGLYLCHQFRRMKGVSDTEGESWPYVRFLNICARVSNRLELGERRPVLNSDVARYIDWKNRSDMAFLQKRYGFRLHHWGISDEFVEMPRFDPDDFRSVLQSFDIEAMSELACLIAAEFLRPDLSIPRYLLKTFRVRKRMVRRYLSNLIMRLSC